MDKQWTKIDATRVTTLTMMGVEVQSHGQVPQPAMATTFRGGSLSATEVVSNIYQMGM